MLNVKCLTLFSAGSEKKALISTSRSCPAPEPLTSSDIDNIHSWISTVSKLCEDSEDRVSDLDRDVTAGETLQFWTFPPTQQQDDVVVFVLMFPH